MALFSCILSQSVHCWYIEKLLIFENWLGPTNFCQEKLNNGYSHTVDPNICGYMVPRRPHWRKTVNVQDAESSAVLWILDSFFSEHCPTFAKTQAAFQQVWNFHCIVTSSILTFTLLFGIHLPFRRHIFTKLKAGKHSADPQWFKHNLSDDKAGLRASLHQLNCVRHMGI
jgi:hypothetical protein